MPTRSTRLRRSAIAGAGLIVLSAVAISLYVWFAASRLLPLAEPGRPIEYLFLGASFWLPLLVFAVVAPTIVILHMRLFVDAQPQPWTFDALDYLAPLLLLGLAPAAGLVLAPNIGWMLPVVIYVLVDLRLWWSAAIVAVVIARIDERRGSRLRQALAVFYSRAFANPRGLFAEGTLLLFLLLFAIVSSPHLRFTSVLHGDEPKYIRYAESFYQGLGVDVGHQREFDELTLSYSPPVWRNLQYFARAIPAEAVNLINDARTFMNAPGHHFNRGKYMDAWFFYGKDGGFYQVHNPGLSALIFPAYFIDRHFVSTSAGYQRVFPGQLPVTNFALLLIWAVWGVLVYRLLLASLARPALAWLLAAAAMVTMPVAAFAFQIYPETTGGLILAGMALWLISGRPEQSAVPRALLAGAASGFLPWLHIRMVLLAVILFVAAMLMLRRRRTHFALAFGCVLGALCLYSYHLTGSLRPDSMYATEGGPSPWTLALFLESAGAVPFDRIWGFFPHAVVYLLAIAGWVPFFRAQPRLAALAAALIAGLVVPAAGHGFSAAGATPLRQSVAVIPLAMLPVGWTLVTWGNRRWVRAIFAILLVVSLDSAWSYNRSHIKETGRMVDAAISGWTPNLVFPWVHGTAWAEWRGTFVLFLLWVTTALAVLLVSLLARRNTSSGPEPMTLRHFVGGVLMFAAIGAGATALGGEWTRGDYFVPIEEARRTAAEYVSGTDRCRACYSSTRGEIGRSDILADPDVQFDFGAEWSDVALGEEARFHAVASKGDKAGWATVAIDFGDGETLRADVFGRTIITHVYKTVGVRKPAARFTAAGRAGQQFVTAVSVRPVSLSLADVDGLPESVKAAPERGSVGRLLLGPDGLVSDSPAPLWLIAWNGQRWLARTAAATREIVPGTWVAVLRADEGGRSSPLVLRWPDPAVAIGAPVVVNP